MLHILIGADVMRVGATWAAAAAAAAATWWLPEYSDARSVAPPGFAKELHQSAGSESRFRAQYIQIKEDFEANMGEIQEQVAQAVSSEILRKIIVIFRRRSVGYSES